MTPLQSDWSPMGLKGIIPSLLHHTLLGYNFLIPDAVGNTTAYGSLFSPLIVRYMKTNRSIILYRFTKKKTTRLNFGSKMNCTPLMSDRQLMSVGKTFTSEVEKTESRQYNRQNIWPDIKALRLS